MGNRDVLSEEQKNMAEAAVESPVDRYFCHKCRNHINEVLPDYTCPHCQLGFIEKLDGTAVETGEASDEDNSELDAREDDDSLVQMADLWNMLSHFRPPDSTGNFLPTPAVPSGSLDVRENRYVSRPGPSRRRYPRVPRTRTGQEPSDTARSRTEGFLQQLVTTLSENTGLVTNASFPVFLNLHSNPGDYAWGRGGWNAIITQLINQLDGTGPPPLPKEKIEEIPTVNICQGQVDKNLQCTVCMEDFKIDEPVRQLTCDHHFHNECITPWLELHGTCPICRKLLNDSSSTPDGVYNSSSMMDTNDMSTTETDSMPRRNNLEVYEFSDDFD